MNCNIISDLIPLYIDGCCSEESKKLVEEHITGCKSCKELLNSMRLPAETTTVTNAPRKFTKLNDWKASVLQSVLLFFSFGLITIGVWLEANTPSGFGNGFWASNLVIPATGFMLSLANWYFIKIYNSRKSFSLSCLAATLGITICAYIWAGFHYELDLIELFTDKSFGVVTGILQTGFILNGIGIILTFVFCILSKVLSGWYARMLGKE